MIPTLLLLGFAAGFPPKGWLCLPLAALAWPLLLLVLGVDSGIDFVFAAAGLAVVNVAAGFALGWLIHQTFLRVSGRA